MSDANFNIAVSVDKTEVAAGFDSVSTDAQAFVESINIQADKLGGSYAKAFASIGEDSKVLAASVSNDQIRIAEATRAVSVAQRENSAALRLVKSGFGDADTNARLYAATLSQVSLAQEALRGLNAVPATPAAPSGPDPNAVVSSAAQSDTSELAKREAAAEIELAAAKLARKEVQDALAQSDVDEATQQAALAAVNEDVAEKEAALTAVKAERLELSKASASAAEEEASAEAARAEAVAIAQQLSQGAYTASSAAARALAAAQLEKAAADVELKARTAEASNALLTEEERISIIAPAAERARLATVELAAANEELASSSRHTVTDVQATSGAIRSLEGNGGIRAVENFISKTLGLGPALQAIFPLVGAFAFGQILFDLGEKAYDLEQKGVHAAKSIAEGFGEMHDKAVVTNDELQVQIDKLEQESAKLSGKPGNGLQLALDESIKRTDQLIESFKGALKASQELFRQNSVTFSQSVLSGVAGTGQQEGELTQDYKDRIATIRKAKADYVAEVRNGGNTEQAQREAGEKLDATVRAVLQKSIDTYKAEYKRLTQEEVDSKVENDALKNSVTGGNLIYAGARNVDNSAKKENIAGVQGQLEEQLNSVNMNDLLSQAQAKVGQQKQDNSGSKDSDKAAQELLRSLETQLAERQQIRELEPAEIQAYWAAYLGSFQRGSTEYKTVLDSVVRYEREAHDQRFKDALKADPASAETLARTKAQFDEARAALVKDQEEGAEALNKGVSAVERWQQQTAANVLRTGKEWETYFREVAKGAEINAQVNDGIAQAQLRALEAVGGITKLGVAQREAAMHSRELAAELKALQEELARAEANAAKSAAPFGATTDPKAAEEVERLKNQIAQLTGKGAQQAVGDQSNIAQQFVAPYKQAFDTVTQDFNSTVVSMLKGQESVSQGFKKMFSNMVLQGGEAAVQWLEKQARTYLLNDLLHVQSSARQTASDASTAAASRAIAAANNLAQIQSLAGVAGAAAFASTAATPIVGLELAPAAAAAAVAGTESFTGMAAFAEGTPMVPRDGIAMLHEGEAVLDSPSAGVMREALGGGSRSPQEMHLHFGGNNFSSAGGDFRSQFSQHEGHVISSIKKWQRDGKM